MWGVSTSVPPLKPGCPQPHVVGDEYHNVGPRAGAFNRLCGKLARHAHDRQDKEGCEQRRIAAQAPGTLVATAFAHLPIGRGRKEPAERHEGHRRDGDGSSRDCVRTASVHTQATNNRGRLP